MRPNLSFCGDKLPRKAKCAYIEGELSLVYEASNLSKNEDRLSNLANAISHQFGIAKPTELLLIADTLTLTFSDDDKHLSLLDAYTNKNCWVTSQVSSIPKVMDHGRLLADTRLCEGDRYSLNLTPRYEIASNQDWVRIVLNDEEETTYYEVAEDLVIGLREQMITDIFLLGVTFL
jgi:hypothetical protein